MRVLALDIGEVRCGLAISDPSQTLASPLCVLPTQEVIQNAKSFKRLVEAWEPELLLAGMPISLTGEAGNQAKRITRQAQQISENCNLPLEFCDERLSSKEAKRILREQGLDEKSMRGKVDMVAASLFLQSWLDRNQQEEEGSRNGA